MSASQCNRTYLTNKMEYNWWQPHWDRRFPNDARTVARTNKRRPEKSPCTTTSPYHASVLSRSVGDLIREYAWYTSAIQLTLFVGTIKCTFVKLGQQNSGQIPTCKRGTQQIDIIVRWNNLTEFDRIRRVNGVAIFIRGIAMYKYYFCY